MSEVTFRLSDKIQFLFFFTRSRLKPEGSFVVRTVIIHIKFNYLKKVSKQLWGRFKWTDLSQCEQLQTQRWVLTVRDVSLRDARSDVPLKVQHCNAMDGRKFTGSSFKPSSKPLNATSSAVCHNIMTSHATHRAGRPSAPRRCCSNLTDGSIMWPSVNRTTWEGIWFESDSPAVLMQPRRKECEKSDIPNKVLSRQGIFFS